MAFTIDSSGNIVPVTGVVPHNVIEKQFTLAQSIGAANAGEKVMLAVSPVDVSQSVELENYLGGYKQSGYAADILSPIVRTDTVQFKRRDHSHTNAFAPVEDRVGRSGAINQIEHASATVEAKCEEHALAAFIPYETDREAAYNVRAAHLEMISDKLTLNREIRRIDTATSVSTWNANNYDVITTTGRWNTGTAKNPLRDLRELMLQSWGPVTGILMNLEVSGYFLADTEVRAYADFNLGTGAQKNGIVVDSGIPGVQTFRLPGLPPFYVVDAKKWVGGAMVSILADDVVLFNAPSVLSGGNTLASFLTFRYAGRNGTGYTVNEYVPYGRGLNGGTMIEAGYSDADVTTGTSADGATTSRIGGLLKSVLTGT